LSLFSQSLNFLRFEKLAIFELTIFISHSNILCFISRPIVPVKLAYTFIVQNNLLISYSLVQVTPCGMFQFRIDPEIIKPIKQQTFMPRVG
jgi:hypothetical protein